MTNLLAESCWKATFSLWSMYSSSLLTLKGLTIGGWLSPKSCRKCWLEEHTGKFAGHFVEVCHTLDMVLVERDEGYYPTLLSLLPGLCIPERD